MDWCLYNPGHAILLEGFLSNRENIQSSVFDTDTINNPILSHCHQSVLIVLSWSFVSECVWYKEEMQTIIPVKCSIVENMHLWIKTQENNESLPEEHVNYQSSQHPVHGVEELSSPNFQIFEYV